VRHQRGWELEEAASGDGLDVEAWADRVEGALDDWAGRTLSGRRVAVPLSGGVDSSLIAVYALRHADECFLVTGDWPDEANPELERARTVADRLGAPLHTALVPPERVAERFPELVRTMEQPLRNYHMFALDAVVEESAALGADLVLHGEAADTLFGSHSLNFVARFSRKRRWLEWLPRSVLTAASRLLPDLHPRLRRLRRLCREDARAALLRYHRIRARADTGRLLGVRSDAPAAEVESRLEGRSEKDTVRQKEVLLYSNAVSHLEMVDRLATPHGMHVLMPYMDSPVLELGLALPPSFHIRDGHVKPVLRTLAARYLDRDFVFTPKMGFPTPFRAWLAGPLAPRVEALGDPVSHVARAFGPRVARGLRFPEDYETIWNLMCLEELLAYAEELAAEPGGSRGLGGDVGPGVTGSEGYSSARGAARPSGGGGGGGPRP
jgi:asparagine synthase (glutamine-hydrolysing)